ncbi:MAG: hypothetical protein E7168_01460 [Firmicutes bacterium]|nr:hypothetical protein [Bacillota bacterium]
MIYLPIEDFSQYECYVIHSSDVIRAYEEIPQVNLSVNYTDFYINSHYMENPGTQIFGNYSNIPTCISQDKFTNVYGYRNDFADILIITIIIVASVWFLICSLIKVLFKGRKLF